jgi:hypothetical protein
MDNSQDKPLTAEIAWLLYAKEVAEEEVRQRMVFIGIKPENMNINKYVQAVRYVQKSFLITVKLGTYHYEKLCIKHALQTTRNIKYDPNYILELRTERNCLINLQKEGQLQPDKIYTTPSGVLLFEVELKPTQYSKYQLNDFIKATTARDPLGLLNDLPEAKIPNKENLAYMDSLISSSPSTSTYSSTPRSVSRMSHASIQVRSPSSSLSSKQRNKMAKKEYEEYKNQAGPDCMSASEYLGKSNVNKNKRKKEAKKERRAKRQQQELEAKAKE